MNKIWTSFKKQFTGWTTFEKVLIVVMLVTLLGVNYQWGTNAVGNIATITGVLCVVLVSKKNVWNYFWGTINVILYAYIAYQAGYGGDFGLNAFYYLPMQFVGIYLWLKHPTKTNSEEVVVHKPTTANYILTIVLLIGLTFLINASMPTWNEFIGMDANPASWIDSFTTAASIVAMVLMVKRMRLQWVIWIAVDILSIIMWAVFFKDYTMTVLWTAYTLNAIYGFYNWKTK